MSGGAETTTTTTAKKQKLNNGTPLPTMSAANPTPAPTPAPAATAVATTTTANGQQQWAQIPIDPALQNTQASPVAYSPYPWPPQPTGAAAASPASGTPQPNPSTTSASATGTTPASTTAPYPAPYYAATAAGYRYPYPQQYPGQPYAYYQAPGGQYYAVGPPPQPVTTAQAQTGTQTPAKAGTVALPTAGTAAGTTAAQGQQQGQGQQATSTLNDALAGIVDLRAEEDALAKSHQDTGSAYYHREGDRSKRPGPALEQSKIWMSERLKAILSAQGLANLPEEALNYAMLAWKARLQGLWDKALSAAEHRSTSQYSRAPSFWNPPVEGTASSIPATPMWSTVVKRDVAKQLNAIERAEKEEEARVRRERRTAAAQAEAENGAEDEMDVDGHQVKKIRPVGQAAKAMPQETNIKLSNNTANRAAGVGSGKYAWMTAGAGASGASAPPKPKPVTTTPAPSTPAATGGATTAATTTTSTTPALKTGGWGRAYAAVSKSANTAAADAKDDGITVTLRDALFVASRERGFGGGRGSALATAAKWE